MIFVIAAYDGGHLSDVANALIHIVEEKHWKLKARIELLKSLGDVDAITMIKMTREGTWTLVPTPQCAEADRHFMDILTPTLSDLTRKAIPTASPVQQVSFPTSIVSNMLGSFSCLPLLRSRLISFASLRRRFSASAKHVSCHICHTSSSQNC